MSTEPQMALDYMAECLYAGEHPSTVFDTNSLKELDIAFVYSKEELWWTADPGYYDTKKISVPADNLSEMPWVIGGHLVDCIPYCPNFGIMFEPSPVMVTVWVFEPTWLLDARKMFGNLQKMGINSTFQDFLYDFQLPSLSEITPSEVTKAQKLLMDMSVKIQKEEDIYHGVLLGTNMKGKDLRFFDTGGRMCVINNFL